MEDEIIEELKQNLAASLQSFRADLKKLRTGRANIGLLDGVRVSYYGSAVPLNQVANLNAPEPRLLTVKPYDKSMIGDIEKAIVQADVGITPQNDGELIRLPIPALTEERRKELVKNARSRGEDAKIALRNHRRDANDMLKQMEKDKEISKDDLKRALDRVQKELDGAIAQVDEILDTKEKEIMEI